ncbi:hypothetical protein IFM89_008663 [Coptis chinensis]|uniref:Uncharacterized protein n=1 Tax=Coptis chinensis TaxID=261450 RepID=A0A835LI77_9MAGN|nr:hypothetical protein IFM89_008663 [Coptis chinensis]
MVKLQNQPTPEGSNPLTEEEIFYEVLGVRPGYKRGLGHGKAPPSRNRVAGYEHPNVNQLRTRAEEAESQLEELRAGRKRLKRHKQHTRRNFNNNNASGTISWRILVVLLQCGMIYEFNYFLICVGVV